MVGDSPDVPSAEAVVARVDQVEKLSPGFWNRTRTLPSVSSTAYSIGRVRSNTSRTTSGRNWLDLSRMTPPRPIAS